MFRFLGVGVNNDAEVGGLVAGREISVFDKVDGLSSFDVGAGPALGEDGRSCWRIG